MPSADRSFRLPAGEHFPSSNPKTGICIHHTVGGSAESTFNWWIQDRGEGGNQIKVGTAYLIAHDGTVHEVFPPDAWAFQFGLPWPPARKLSFEQRFIGIELASEGGLIESDGDVFCFDRISPGTRRDREKAFDFGSSYRGYRYFDRYEDSQVTALVGLIDELCDEFDIPRRVPDGFLDFYGDLLVHFEGIIGHGMVRRDKTDPLPDLEFWQRVVDGCGLEPVAIEGADVPVEVPRAPEGTRHRGLTDAEKDALHEHNARQIDRMDQAAAGVISALLSELEDRDRQTYLRLTNPQERGHRVEFELVQGDRDLLQRIGRFFGLTTLTDTVLVVRHG